jgi:hypothetical protein
MTRLSALMPLAIAVADAPESVTMSEADACGRRRYAKNFPERAARCYRLRNSWLR